MVAALWLVCVSLNQSLCSILVDQGTVTCDFVQFSGYLSRCRTFPARFDSISKSTRREHAATGGWEIETSFFEVQSGICSSFCIRKGADRSAFVKLKLKLTYFLFLNFKKQLFDSFGGVCSLPRITLFADNELGNVNTRNTRTVEIISQDSYLTWRCPILWVAGSWAEVIF